MTKNCAEVMEVSKNHENQQISSKRNKSIHRYVIIKLQKTKGKGKNHKSNQMEKRLSTNTSRETIKTKRQENVI